VSKFSAKTATQLLKIRSYKTAVIHGSLARAQSSYQGSILQFVLQSVIEGEIDPQLTFFSDEAWFHLQGYINTQNNRHWSSQNPHLTHEALLHRVKVGVWCAVNARIVGPVFF
jgi:hypothetical protein